MIKNIIFDVGDVLLEYRWHEMLLEYGLSEEEAYHIGQLIFADNLWEKGMDTGIMTEDEVIEAYKERYPKEGPIIEWFIRNGEKMHIGRPEIWDRMKALKERGYGIYLLSNYSKELFRKHTQDADFMNYIDGKVVSYEIYKIKPDPAIYHHLMDTYGLKPEECLFFDDRERNVQGAEAVGISAILVTSREQLAQELDKIL